MTDNDVWLHLRVGETICKTHQIPRKDFLSYTQEGKPWVLHEWLSQIILYGLWKIGGENGLIFFKAFLILACYLLVYLFSVKNNPGIHHPISITLAALASQFHFFERPHIFSFLFLSLFILILHHIKQGLKLSKAALLLCLIQLLWVNMHGSWILGPVLLFIYLTGNILSDILLEAKSSRPLGWARALQSSFLKKIAILLFFISAINLINPYGVQMLLLPFQIVHAPLFQEMIVEWFSPFAKIVQPAQKYILGIFLAYTIYLGITLWLNRRKTELWQWGVCCAFFSLACRSVRMIPIFSFATLPIALLSSERTIENAFAGKKDSRVVTIVCGIGIAALIFLVCTNRFYVWQRLPERFALGVSPQQFPIGAAEFIREQKIQGKGFNTLGWGSYLIWSLPKKKVFIDGRGEIYGETFMQYYWNSISDLSLWRALTDRFQFDYLLLPAGQPVSALMLPYLSRAPDWALVYFDETSLLFCKRNGLEAQWLKEHEISGGLQRDREYLPKIQPTESSSWQIDFPAGMIRIAATYELLGDADRALRYYEKALEIYPWLTPEAHYNTGRIYLQRGEWEKAKMQFQKAIKLNSSMSQAYYALGLAEFKMRHLREAKKQWEKALKFDPKNVEIKKALSIVSSQMPN